MPQLRKKDSRTEDEKKADRERSYNWTTILYPESCVPDYANQLSLVGAQVAISPLHDRDVDSNGNIKKPHYHVIMHFKSQKSRSQVRMIVEKIKGVGCETVLDLTAYTQYLVHLNDADKVKYDVKDIVTIGGYNLDKYFKDKVDYDLLFASLINYIEENDVREYSELVLSLIRDDNMDLVGACRRNAFAVNTYLRSRSCAIMRKARDKFYEDESKIIKFELERRQIVKDGFEHLPSDFDFGKLDEYFKSEQICIDSCNEK